MANQYFTRENLKNFLEWLKEKEPFETYNRAHQNSGLELKLLDDVDENGILQIGEGDPKRIMQGSYYYYLKGVNGINLHDFYVKDNRVMGEAMVQFKTNKNDGTIACDGGDDWKWILSDGGIVPVLRPDSSYQIHITSDQQENPTIFATLNKFESISVDDVVGGSSNVWIRIEYEVSGNSFEALSTEWLKGIDELLINKVLYAADGINFKAISINTLKTNNKLSNSANNPVLIVEFLEDRALDFSYLLKNINFDKFNMQIPAKNISSMRGMFMANSSNKSCTSIDLTGISDSNGFNPEGGVFKPAEAFVELFKGRKLKVDSDGTKLKLFGPQQSGLNTKYATSLKSMFENGPLLNIHCNPVYDPNNGANDPENYKHGPYNIFRRLNVTNCNDFSCMFAGCNINTIDMAWLLSEMDLSKVDWILRKESLSKDATCSYAEMFRGTNIKDESVKGIYDFIKTISNYDGYTNKEKQLKKLYLNGLFNSCSNINEAQIFDLSSLIRNHPQLKTVNLSQMFMNCKDLNNVPILDIVGYEEISQGSNGVTSTIYNPINPELETVLLSSMFEGSGTARTDINFNNFYLWRINPFLSKNGIVDYSKNFELKMDQMFYKCPLYKLKNGSGRVLNFGRRDSDIGNGDNCDMTRMFAETGYQGKPYNINFNMINGFMWEGDPSKTPGNCLEGGSVWDFANMYDMLDVKNSGEINIYNPLYGLGHKDYGDSIVYAGLKNRYMNSIIINNIKEYR